jgi:hypothetical protein
LTFRRGDMAGGASLRVDDIQRARVDTPASCSCTATSIPAPAGEVLLLRVAGEVDLLTVAILQGADQQPRAGAVSPAGRSRRDDLLLRAGGLACCTAAAGVAAAIAEVGALARRPGAASSGRERGFLVVQP